MIIDNLNLNLLRIFEAVYRHKSMTAAAKELFMTQSGASQNIKNLEEILEVTLFDRVKRRLVATDKADILFKMCSENLFSIERTLAQLKGVETQLTGVISIGIPNEYGNNIILPLLSEWGMKQEGLSFELKYGLAQDLKTSLLSGELDFAIVDSFGFDGELKTIKIGDERLALCASESYLESRPPKSKLTKKYFESLDYIGYAKGAPTLRMWFKHHYGHSNLNTGTRATLMNVQGVAQMIMQNFGVGILPMHMVKNLEDRGEAVHVFKGGETPLLNSISLAYLEGRTFSPAAQETINFIISSLKK